MLSFWRWLVGERVSSAYWEREAGRLSDRCRELERALFCEIERNRVRETALMDLICRAVAREAPLGRLPHSPLSALGEVVRPAVEVTAEGGKEGVGVDEMLVERRARDFYEQARANGIEYDFEVLKETIRRNPEQYLVD